MEVVETDGVAILNVMRNEGANGMIKCRFQTESQDDPRASAPFSDYIPSKGALVFQPNETQQEIRIEILPQDSLDRRDFFKVKIFDPSNETKISRKDFCNVWIIGDAETKKELDRIEKVILEHK